MVLLLCVSCVDPFMPDIEESQEVLVIDGVITDRPGAHHVTVSRSAPFNEPSFEPVAGCVVRVEDELGEMRMYEETDSGAYEAWLDRPFLGVGKSYCLIVHTPDGNQYRSSYDTLLACPPIDTLYYEVKKQGTPDPEVTYTGLQFYADITGSPSASRNFRWLLEETWEYRSSFLIQYIWDGLELHEYLPPLYDYYACFMNEPVRGLFSASTRIFSVNRLQKQPLNYVSNRTPRLKIKYSLLVRQQSLTDEIHAYWNAMRSQASEGGGLYETQPSSVRGNIYNVHDMNEKVLGCFYATQQHSKRITVVNSFDFEVPGFRCPLDTVMSPYELEAEYPYYMISLNPFGTGPPYGVADPECFDCRLRGGVTTVPDYW
jgi:hypothetical protein